MNKRNSNKEIYFDNNATTKPLPEVREEVCKLLGEEFGNPSSIHSTGERARKYLANARQHLADLLGCSPENIIFTSSGTEANNLVLYSCTVGAKEKSRIVTSNVEHSSINKMCSFLEIRGVEVEYLKVDPSGFLNLEDLEKALEKETDLVSIQWVNNETGVIQDIESIARICRERGVPFHTDSAQAVGKLDFKITGMDIDYLTLAAHKFHAPQGVGALYAKDKLTIHPVLFGGFQEEGFRPGTENVPAIVGMGKAAEIRKVNLKQTVKHMCDVRSRFENLVLEKIPGARVNGSTEKRICNTTNIMFGNVDGRKLTKMLDEEGIRCSQSSACTNFDTAPSFVLKAMGLADEEAYASIRFSFSEENSAEEIEKAVDIITACHSRLVSESAEKKN